MICKNCNNTIPDNSVFCMFCGQKVVKHTNSSDEFGQQKVDEIQTVASEAENYQATSEKSEETKNNVETSSENLNSEDNAPEINSGESCEAKPSVKKNSKKKKFIISSVCTVLVLAIIATVLIMAFSGKDKNDIDKNFVYPKNTYTAMVTSVSTLSSSLNAELYSGDKSIATFEDAKSLITSINGLFYINSSDELYYFDGKNNEKIADDAFKIISVSANGDFVYYSAKVDGESSYCRYDLNNKNSQVLFKENDGTIYQFCPSENGKYVAYTLGKYNSSKFKTVYNSYVYNGSETTEIDEEEFRVLSISNDGKSIYGYYVDGRETKIIAIVNGEKTEVCENVSELDSGYAVLNYSQDSLICYSDSYFYLSKNYQKAEKLFKSTSSSISPCMPDDAKYIKDFKNTFWEAGGNLVYLDGDFKDYTVDKNIYGYRLLKNGTLFYIDDNSSLYKVTASTVEKPEKIAGKVDKFYPTDDGEKIYYINKSGTAYVYSKGEKTEILEDVYNIVVSAKDEVFLLSEYSTNMGELYFYNGKKCSKVDSDVSSVIRVEDDVWYLAEYDSDEKCYDAYLQKSGKEFKKVKEQIYAIGNSAED